MGGKALVVVFGIIAIMIAMVMFPMILTGSHEILTDADTDAFTNVTTAVGVTSADVVLSNSLYNDAVSQVSSVSSSLETDTPVASTYTAGTKTLHVTGLTASETRTLTVVYDYGATSDYTGLSSLVKVGPVILFIGLLVVGLGLIVGGVKGKLGM